MAITSKGVHGKRSRDDQVSVCLRAALATALVLACAGCGAGAELAPLTPEDVAESGTLMLDAPRQTVLDACVLALRKAGYAIDVARPETGLVVTMRRLVPDAGSSGRGLYRAYVLEVKDSPGGGARVSAWPAVSEHEVARGNRPFEAPAWDLDEERAAWARLFEDVRGIAEKASP